jgi:hypothetical protein
MTRLAWGDLSIPGAACAASLQSGSVESDCVTTGFIISERPGEAIDPRRTRPRPLSPVSVADIAQAGWQPPGRWAVPRSTRAASLSRRNSRVRVRSHRDQARTASQRRNNWSRSSRVAALLVARSCTPHPSLSLGTGCDEVRVSIRAPWCRWQSTPRTQVAAAALTGSPNCNSCSRRRTSVGLSFTTRPSAACGVLF